MIVVVDDRASQWINVEHLLIHWLPIIQWIWANGQLDLGLVKLGFLKTLPNDMSMYICDQRYKFAMSFMERQIEAVAKENHGYWNNTYKSWEY